MRMKRKIPGLAETLFLVERAKQKWIPVGLELQEMTRRQLELIFIRKSRPELELIFIRKSRPELELIHQLKNAVQSDYLIFEKNKAWVSLAKIEEEIARKGIKISNATMWAMLWSCSDWEQAQALIERYGLENDDPSLYWHPVFSDANLDRADRYE